jgi:uncharacterized protein YbbC (DUF1343 family)
MFTQTSKPLELQAYPLCGADQTELYLPLLQHKRVALLTNASGLIKGQFLLDTLLKRHINIVKVFGPEHGFRGKTDASTTIADERDPLTGIDVISLYGSQKKPSIAQLKDVDIVVYDIQDVGVRFYTYLSTLSYMLERCADLHIPVMVLDRPNPNGFYIDGPVMESDCRSFLGRFPIPVVYGMTSGELAQMIVGESWLECSRTPSLLVIPMQGYARNKTVQLPVPPSPNLKTLDAILNYPSLGWMEGTCLSLGRGTESPFMLFGHPHYSNTRFSFTPLPNQINTKPRYAFTLCYGKSLAPLNGLKNHPRQINLHWLIEAYAAIPDSVLFFESTFDKHSGNKWLQNQIKQGMSETQIRQTWINKIEHFKKLRKRYLLYPDF